MGWDHGARRVWSLFAVLTFYASRFVSSTSLTALLSVYFDKTVGAFQAEGGDIPSKSFYAEIIRKLGDLHDQLEEMGLSLSVKAADRIVGRLEGGARLPEMAADMKELQSRIVDELDSVLLLRVDADRVEQYRAPLAGWEAVVDRFSCAFDIEEATKCFATERHTACVFHLMRVVESAVLELQIFLREKDLKAHFGSVIQKLETLVQKARYDDVSTDLQSYLPFMREVLPQLHAVKDSWRNKVAHLDNRIIPTETFTEELASGVYSATLLLMNKLATGLPAKEDAAL
jgi:hypothetical protein